MNDELSIRDLYDPKFFGEIGKKVNQLLVDHFEHLQDKPSRGLTWADPDALKAKVRETLDRAEVKSVPSAIERLAELSKLYLDTSNPLHSPHCMGHQVPPPIPFAGQFDLVGSTTNNASGVYEMGPLHSAIERVLIEKLGSYLGWDGLPFDGVVTHGGSLANFTALLAARSWKYPDSWKKGFPRSGPRPAILTSRDSHYSVSRAASMMGLGAEQVIKVPIDGRRKMDISELTQILDQAASQGLEVFCLVASACTTSTGSFDPLEEIAKLCKSREIWLHVDAAHGGGLLLSKKYKSLLNGIEHADSVTWDAHKMMFVPALCTFLLYRDKKRSFQVFDQEAPYLFSQELNKESNQQFNPTLEYDSAVRTVECTKRPLTLPLWAIWSTFGPNLIGRLVDTTIDLTKSFHTLLERSPDFEPVHEPECNILCFRYLPDPLKNQSEETVSKVQKKIRKKLLEAGNFYITQSALDGRDVLRVALMNPLTRIEHLETLMDEIRKIGVAS